MMTGHIFSAMIRCRAVIPSSFGMLISMVTTSGFNSMTFCTASSPSRAVAITLMSGAPASSRVMVLRINAESSAMTTRMTQPGLITLAGLGVRGAVEGH